MILFEDKSIIVCHKPAGLPVQSARIGQQDMVSILNNHLAETAGGKGALKEPEQVHVVHRLDQPVEGVIVFAKNKKAAAGLTRQITQGTIKKIYHAICCCEDPKRWGIVSDEIQQENLLHVDEPDKHVMTICRAKSDRFTLVDYLVKDNRTNSSAISTKENKNAKRAELSFTIKRAVMLPQCYARVEVELGTGRHHQIRIQMAGAGLPLYGDRKYNPKWQEYVISSNGTSGKDKMDSLALCAVEYTFAHPITGKNMSFRVEPKSAVWDVLA